MTRQQFFEENRNLGNFPVYKVLGKFPRLPGIRGIPEISEIPKEI